MRLNKFLASGGIGSRRACDGYIQQGRVAVNGVVQTQPATQVSVNDEITFDGRPVKIDRDRIYLKLYKPRGTLTTVRDPYGRETVMKYVDGIQERIFPVGRLDYESEGLLLFTNDGLLTNILTHPRYQMQRTYRVFVSGQIQVSDLDLLIAGIQKNSEHYRLQSATVIDEQKGFTVVDATLNEGKKHEVRILFESIGHPVLRLIRIKMGPIFLDWDMLPGEWRYLTSIEIDLLRTQGGVWADVNE